MGSKETSKSPDHRGQALKVLQWASLFSLAVLSFLSWPPLILSAPDLLGLGWDTGTTSHEGTQEAVDLMETPQHWLLGPGSKNCYCVSSGIAGFL
jgi:hypothetical protein